MNVCLNKGFCCVSSSLPLPRGKRVPLPHVDRCRIEIYAGMQACRYDCLIAYISYIREGPLTSSCAAERRAHFPQGEGSLTFSFKTPQMVKQGPRSQAPRFPVPYLPIPRFRRSSLLPQSFAASVPGRIFFFSSFPSSSLFHSRILFSSDFLVSLFCREKAAGINLSRSAA